MDRILGILNGDKEPELTTDCIDRIVWIGQEHRYLHLSTKQVGSAFNALNLTLPNYSTESIINHPYAVNLGEPTYQ
jgi:hypothetical protein